MDVTTQKLVNRLMVDKFSGINNVDPPTRLSPKTIAYANVYPLWEANNVDIDNSFAISSRSGYDKVISGSDIHSMWSDENIALFVDGGTLYRYDQLFVTYAIRSGLTSGARMSYCKFNDRIYYSNGFQIGHILNATSTALIDPALEFKLPIPAGQLIECFLGSLYSAVGNILYISDSLCDYYDVRTGYKIFKDNISLLRAVNEDGVYVSDSETWFLKGKANEEFERQSVYPQKAIPFTDVVIPGNYIDEGLTSDVVMWTAENGILVGDGNGKVVNLTEDRFLFDPTSRGSAFVREKSNVRHYINTLF